MLTVDFDKLPVRPGESVLDIGCGGGRHAFEALRRGAAVVALDSDAAELKDVGALMAAMSDAGEVPASGWGVCVQGDARRLPFRGGTFDHVVASEVLEHVREDTLAMGELARVLVAGGSMAVTVPRMLPEFVNWLLSEDYHARPGGHLRIYTRSTLARRLRAAGMQPFAARHVHALHSPYWWLRCAVGINREGHPLVGLYHRLLVWEIESSPPVMQLAEAWLRPFIGKSLVLYTTKVPLSLGRRS